MKGKDIMLRLDLRSMRVRPSAIQTVANGFCARYGMPEAKTVVDEKSGIVTFTVTDDTGDPAANKNAIAQLMRAQGWITR